MDWRKKHVFLWSGPSGQNTKSWQISSPLSRTWFSKEHLLHLPMPPSGIHYSWRTTFNLHFEEVLYKYVIYCLCGCRKHKIYVMIIWYDCWYGNRRRSEGWMPTGWTIRPFPMPSSEINLNTIHIWRIGLKYLDLKLLTVFLNDPKVFSLSMLGRNIEKFKSGTREVGWLDYFYWGGSVTLFD